MQLSYYSKIYSVVRRIPAGKVMTYADVARLAGRPGAARAVGTAMRLNPDPQTIPCHRVVGSSGHMHGYAFGEGIPTKLSLLANEGVALSGNRVNLATCRWRFEKDWNLT